MVSSLCCVYIRCGLQERPDLLAQALIWYSALKCLGGRTLGYAGVVPGSTVEALLQRV